MAITKDFDTEINSFRTVNTKDSPVSMKDDEAAILINFMPIGTTPYTVPGYSDDLATIGNSETAWTANTAVTQNVTVRRPTVPNGFIYLCTTTGTTHATTEPTWPTTPLSTVSDGTAVWTTYSSNVLRFFDINIGGTLYKIVATTGGALYRLDGSYTQVRLCIPGTFTNPRFEQWKYTNLLIIDAAGYYDYDGATLTKHTTLSAPSSGSCIAVFKTRVWIGSGRTLAFSSPDSFTDFTTGSSGGVVIDNYPSLRNQINALAATQDYLYVVGDHATHLIAGVQIYSTGSTVFQLFDGVPGIGSIYPDTVQVLGDSVLMMGDAGVHAVSGSNHELLSSYLDGIYPRISTAFSPVACFVKIYNKLCYAVLVSVPHPIDGSMQKFLFCYYEKRWFYVLYDAVPLTYLAQKSTTTDTQTFASYGNKLIQIFTGESVLEKRIRTKAYNFGTPNYDKQVLWLGATLANNTGLITPITATMSAIGSGNVDASTGQCTVTFTPGVTPWLNASGVTVVWQNASSQTVTWSAPYSDMLGLQTLESSGRGKRIQIDYSEISSASYSLNGIMIGGQYGADR